MIDFFKLKLKNKTDSPSKNRFYFNVFGKHEKKRSAHFCSLDKEFLFKTPFVKIIMNRVMDLNSFIK